MDVSNDINLYGLNLSLNTNFIYLYVITYLWYVNICTAVQVEKYIVFVYTLI